MKEKTLFLNMFSDYEPPEPLKRVFSQAVISAAGLDPTLRTVDIDLACPEYIPQRLLDQVTRDIVGVYGLNRLDITPIFPANQLHEIEPEELMYMFVRENSMTRGSLAGAKWDWEDDTLVIRLLGNGKKALDDASVVVRNELSRRFSGPVNIRIEAGEALEGQALFDAMAKMRHSQLSSMPAASVAAQAPKQEAAPTNSETIFGKPFKGNVTPMKDVQLDMGGIIVEGRVFAVDHRELKNRNAWVVSFDVTDYTGSVRVKSFMENNKAKPLLEQINVGSVVRIRGDLSVDRYDNELVLKPYAIMPGTMPKRQDTAEGMKRVELHLHTTMSSMDALTDTQAAVKQAAAWGHRAVAITDHGCAHSFPDAMHAVEGKGAAKVAGTDEIIKVLYGCEGYFVDDMDGREIVVGCQDMSFDQEFVAFDLETTGLSVNDDTITEIGAVLFRDGKEVASFQSFVAVHRKLDPENIKLTGITDEMLEGAPEIDEVLPEFLKFVGDRVVVAHNARFDTGFVRKACERLGIQYNLTSVDTLPLAQQLMPQLNKFKLDGIARALKLPSFNHHRAADDANICGQIFVKFLKMLDEDGYSSIQQVNLKLAFTRSKGRIYSRRPYHILVFAKNQQGLRNLYHLISDSNLEYFKKTPRMPKSLLMELREGLIIGSACEAGELFQAILEGKNEEELKRIASFYDFLEIQPLSNNRFMLEKGIAKDEEQLREFNRTVVRLGEALGKPVVATGDVHFLNPEDEKFRHILLASRGFEDADCDNPLYFRTTDEMLKEFAYLGEEKAYEVVVTNTNLIADMCDLVRPVPHNLFAPSIENSVEDLKNLVYTKFHRLYGDNPPELMVKRVETELNDIITCHYDVIYMSARSWCRILWNMAIWLAPVAPLVRPSLPICPALRRSIPSHPITAVPTRTASTPFWMCPRALTAVRTCRTQYAPSVVPIWKRMALTSPSKPSLASAAIRCPISI